MIKMKYEKRTNIDFSKHELTVTENELITIHWLKRPDYNINNVKFINTESIMVVTGDFGRWTFSRQFVPSANFEGVSIAYWCEKIKTGSEQKTHIFDSEIAEQSIKEKIEDLLENSEIDEDGNVCFQSDSEQEEYDFWNEMLDNCEDEFQLNNCFYDEKPNSIELESFPDCKRINEYLLYIFDAFEEICTRLND